MEPNILPIILLALVFIAIQSVVIIFLVKRAIELKSRSLWYLTCSFCAFLVSAIFGATNSPLQIFVQAFAPIFIIGFTKLIFHFRARSNYVLVLLVSLIFATLTFILKIVRLTTGDSSILYLVNQIMLFVVFFSSYAWLAKSCLDAYQRFARSTGVQPWIRKRYLLLGSSSFLTMFSTTPSLFMSSTEGFYSWQGFFCLLTIVSILLIFSIVNYFCWVMPPWFKLRLGILPVTKLEDAELVSKAQLSPDFNQKYLTTRETISIIDYLGNMLAYKINKNPSAAKGLLLLAIQAEQGDKDVQLMSISDVSHVITHKLNLNLKQLGFKDADTITSEFNAELIKDQSILFMMSI